MIKPRTSALSAAIVAAAFASQAQAGEIWVSVDQARSLKLDRPAASIIVGNPSIADVTVYDDQALFVLGKSTGVTNLIALDGEGREIANMAINVSGARRNVLTLNRGGAQVTYNCTHRCERMLMVGDAMPEFEPVASQNATKSDAAAEAAIAGRAGDS